MRLPDLLTASDLPAAELHALRLDGVLYALAGTWRPADLPETPEARAGAVAAAFRGRLIADRLTAAWVLGAADFPPPILQGCVTAESRGASGTPGVDVRELQLEEQDLTSVGSLRLTTALRSAADLLRSREWNRRREDAVRRLLGLVRPEELVDALHAERFTAHRSRALDRLDDLRRRAIPDGRGGQPAETR
jgi:hypothetical protein